MLELSDVEDQCAGVTWSEKIDHFESTLSECKLDDFANCATIVSTEHVNKETTPERLAEIVTAYICCFHANQTHSRLFETLESMFSDGEVSKTLDHMRSNFTLTWKLIDRYSAQEEDFDYSIEMRYKAFFGKLQRLFKASTESFVSYRIFKECTDLESENYKDLCYTHPLFSAESQHNSDIHQLLLFYWEKGMQAGLKRLNGALYKPKVNSDGIYMFAYEYSCDISEYVYKALEPYQENRGYFEIFLKKGTAKQMESLIQNMETVFMPTLRRNGMVHSFQNGIYVINEDKFYNFQPKENELDVSELKDPTDYVAVKFHNQIFDNTGMMQEMFENEDVEQGLSHQTLAGLITLQHVEKILLDQDFTVEEIDFIFALMGRMLYPVGQVDNWSVFPYFLGIAGTGKSTLLRLVASFFEQHDVAYINNAGQKTFALDGIYGKKLFLCLDVDESFTLDQATFQSMVTGEEVSVVRKNKQPKVVKWDAPGGMAGNNLPGWTDNGGSLYRRLIIINYCNQVKAMDPKLFDKCMSQKDRFLKRINCAYLSHVQRYGDLPIKNHMPDRFRRDGERALLKLNSLLSFIKDVCELGDPLRAEGEDDYFVTLDEFQKQYKLFCKKTDCKSRPLTNTFTQHAFAKCGIKLKRKEHDNEAPDYIALGQKYLTGVRILDIYLNSNH